MSSKFNCPYCNEQYPMVPELVGKKVECTNCGKKFLIGPASPAGSTPASAPAASAPGAGPAVPAPHEDAVKESAADSTLYCPKCGKQYDARVHRPGEVIACGCGSPFRIPGGVPRKRLHRTTASVSPSQREALRDQFAEDIEPPTAFEKQVAKILHPYGFLFYVLFLLLVWLLLGRFDKKTVGWYIAWGFGLADLFLIACCLVRGLWLLLRAAWRAVGFLVKPAAFELDTAPAISLRVLMTVRSGAGAGLGGFLLDLAMLPFPFVFHPGWLPNVLNRAWSRWRFLQDAVSAILLSAYVLAIVYFYTSTITTYFTMKENGLEGDKILWGVLGVLLLNSVVIALGLLLLKTVVAVIGVLLQIEVSTRREAQGAQGAASGSGRQAPPAAAARPPGTPGAP